MYSVNKYIIASTQITSTEIFALNALVFKLLSLKVLKLLKTVKNVLR